MSDVIVSTTESATNVTTTNDVTTIAVTNNVVEVSASTAGVQGASYTPGDPIYVYVTNKTGGTLSKGSIVYTSGANGVHTQVSLALASGDATSARTLGWLAEDLANNATGLCQVEGYLDGINTQGITEGAQLYLSGTTAGGFTESKPQAPIHLVYVGVCSKASAGNGRVYVKVQNGYELDELHDVQIISVANNNLIQYDSATSLWKNVASTAITAGSAITSGTASYATTSGTAITISGSITKSQVSDFTSGTVASAGTAQQAGTAVYATTSGTSVSISGSITRSQVSDFASGTVTNISGTVAQSQVTNLTTDLANRAKLDTANTFTVGGHIISNASTAVIPLIVRGVASQSANLLEIQNSGSTAVALVTSAGALTLKPVANAANQNRGILLSNTSDLWQSGLYLKSDASGNPRLSILAPTGTLSEAINIDAAAKVGLGFTDPPGQLSVAAALSTRVAAVVRGAASQSANLQEWQTSAGGTVVRITASGSLLFPNSSTSINGDTGNAIIQANSASTTHLVLRGASSQSADMLQIQNNSSATAVRVNVSGQASFGGTALLGQVTVLPASTATVGVVVQGLSGQSSDLQQWQTNAGGILAKLDPSGTFYSTILTTMNSYASLVEENAGGRLRLNKGTAAMTNPGTNIAKIYLRDGTTAGTLKLVVRAGTAGAETTILDNIPQS